MRARRCDSVRFLLADAVLTLEGGAMGRGCSGPGAGAAWRLRPPPPQRGAACRRRRVVWER